MDLNILINFFKETVWIIPLLPLLAFLLIIADRSFARLTAHLSIPFQLFPKKEYVAFVVIGATFLGFVQSVFLFFWSLKAKAPEEIPFEVSYPWLTAGNFTLSFGWLLDNLSILLLLIVTSVSMLIQIYTHGYMEKDPGYRRFYSYLALFNFSMLGLVLSQNLFQMYIFWELVGLCSYLLIGFWLERPSATKAAMKAFIMNRIGDSIFLIGIVGFLFYTYKYWLDTNTPLLSFTKLPDAIMTAAINAGPEIFAAIAICIFFGAIAKSAQFPLHTWLPDAMEGPTPISALIHAATMVAAGVYLVARAYPIFQFSPLAMTFIAWIGAITVFITASIALTQYDLKRILAYSTCSQLGYMIFAMGIGAYSAGLFHLTTHAYFKAMLFLCSGAVIHGLSGEQDVRFMGGLRKYMPRTAITYLIGTVAISGILFSGFWSKDMILGKAFEGILNENGSFNYIMLCLFILVTISAFLTAFYMFRSYFLTFEGGYKGHSHPHESPPVMTIPLIVLAIPSAFLGLFVSGLLIFPDFTSYINISESNGHHMDIVIAIMSLLIALAGAAFAAVFYFEKLKSQDSEVYKAKFNFLYKLSYNKWYFDEIYGWLIDKIFITLTKASSLFDKYIIDAIVNLIAQLIKFWGDLLKYTQNGQVQFAVLTMYAGIVIISIVLIIYAML